MDRKVQRLIDMWRSKCRVKVLLVELDSKYSDVCSKILLASGTFKSFH